MRWNGGVYKGAGSKVVRVWSLVRTTVVQVICDQRLLQMQILFSIHVRSFAF